GPPPGAPSAREGHAPGRGRRAVPNGKDSPGSWSSPLRRLRRVPVARNGLEHADAVALGVGERDILPHTGYLDRLAEHMTARISDLPHCSVDIVHRDHD